MFLCHQTSTRADRAEDNVKALQQQAAALEGKAKLLGRVRLSYIPNDRPDYIPEYRVPKWWCHS